MQRWNLNDLGPDFPADWSEYRALVLEMRASSAQYFELAVITAQGERSVRVHPFEGVWVRAAIPLWHFREPMTAGFDLASLGNKPRKTTMINFHRNQGPLVDVQGVRISIPNPVGSPTVEVRTITLAREDPGDAVIDALPLVDEFGQWIPAGWPEKARSLADLQAAWAREEETMPPAPEGLSPYGGYLGQRVQATGFFRVEQVDGRWWLVDPQGCLFYSAGADVIAPMMGTPIEGREEFFAALPPEPFRYAPRRGGSPAEASFTAWNLSRRYGERWAERWADMTLRRMTAWGLNTVASWSDSRLWDAQRRPYVVTLSGWGIEDSVMGLPDIYDEGYAQKIDQAAAAQCAPRSGDPWLLGYFVANEPAWPERELLLVDQILAGPPAPLQRALNQHLVQFGDSPAERTRFVHSTFEQFLALVTAAIRRHDPNHLNLGIRFGGTAPEAVIRMARAFDVYSHNIYSYAPDPAFLDRLYALTGRPMLIGEFHIGAPGRGLDAGLVQVPDQRERGAAYQYYVEQAAAHPAVVGTHWFQWWDQPSTGRMDGENYAIGLVDVTDRPYPHMVEALRRTHDRLFAVHSGAQPPTAQRPAGMGSDVISYHAPGED